MTVFITLTLAGANVGPFNLYSDVDLYTTAFETAVATVDLTSGYASDLVPDGTTIIRLLSTGECNNYFDIVLSEPTTTTSSSSSTSTTTTSTTSPR